MSNKLHVKKDDTVLILSGDEKGKQGKVLAVSPKEGKVIVEGINMIKKHVKPRQAGEQGGIIEAEGAMYASKQRKLFLLCLNQSYLNLYLLFHHHQHQHQFCYLQLRKFLDLLYY